MRLYQNYLWKKGVPKGLEISKQATGYQLVSDPYGRRHLIEYHVDGCFKELIYDSLLFNFRHLHERYQIGASKEPLDEGSFLIRDRDHMPLFIEKHTYWEEKSIKCAFYSPHGICFGFQEIEYAPQNSVTLYDLHRNIVMKKTYESDESGQFTTLKCEQY